MTSLRPELLLHGVAFAAEMLQPEHALELVAVRRNLESAASSLAARYIDEPTLAALAACLDDMRTAERRGPRPARCPVPCPRGPGDRKRDPRLDADGGSSETVRARVWRGNLDERVIARTLSQHADILDALVARDPVLAEATAIAHVATTEAWLREVVTERARGVRRDG